MFKKTIAAAAALATFCLNTQVLGAGTITASAASILEFTSFPYSYTIIGGDTTVSTDDYSLEIFLSGNKGVQSWVLLLDYDNTKLTYDSVTLTEEFSGIEVKDTGNTLIINDYETGDVYANGLAVTVNFTMKPGLAPGIYSDCFNLRVSEETDDFFNSADETLPATASNASTTMEIKDKNYVSVKFDSRELYMQLNEKQELVLEFYAASDEAIEKLLDLSKWKFSVNSPAISFEFADGVGTVTANSNGTAVITATHPDYVDKNGDPIPVTCTVNVSDTPFEGYNIYSRIRTANAPEGTPLEFELLQGGKVIQTATVTEYDQLVFSGLSNGDYKLRVTCSDDSYAGLYGDFTVNGRNITFVKDLYQYGDLNCDNKRDVNDLILLQKIIAGWDVNISYDELANINKSEDGRISIDDLILYQKYIAGWKVNI